MSEQEDIALQIMERTASNLGIRVETLVFDGLVLDFSSVADASAANAAFHRLAEEDLQAHFGFPLLVADKEWNVAIACDEGEGDDDLDIPSAASGGAHGPAAPPSAAEGKHLCIPESLAAAGVNVNMDVFKQGPYTYRSVVDKVPGLSLTPMFGPSVDGFYLKHLDFGDEVGECEPVVVSGGRVVRCPNQFQIRHLKRRCASTVFCI